MKTLFFILTAISVSFVAVMLVNDDSPSAAWKRIAGGTPDQQQHLKVTPEPVTTAKAAKETPTQSMGAATTGPTRTPETAKAAHTPVIAEVAPTRSTRAATSESTTIPDTPTPTPTPNKTAEAPPTRSMGAATSEPTPTPETTSPQLSPAHQNLIASLITHPQERPREIKIKQSVTFPALYDGRVIGAIKKPSGTSVKVIDINATNVTISFNGGSAQTPIENTDLLEVATLQVAKSPSPTAELSTPQRPPGDMAQKKNALTNNSTKNDPREVSDFLNKSPIDARELSRIIDQYPDLARTCLSNKSIMIKGKISDIQVTGLDHEKFEIGLASASSNIVIKGNNQVFWKQIYNDWKTPKGLYHTSNSDGYRNIEYYRNVDAFNLENKSQFENNNDILSIRITPNNSNYNTSTTTVTDSHGEKQTYTYRKRELLKDQEIVLCTIGEDFPQWILTLSSAGAKFAFDILKVTQK